MKHSTSTIRNGSITTDIPCLSERVEHIRQALALMEVTLEGLMRGDDRDVTEDVLSALQGQLCDLRTVDLAAIQNGLDIVHAGRMPAPEQHQWEQARVPSAEELRPQPLESHPTGSSRKCAYLQDV